MPFSVTRGEFNMTKFSAIFAILLALTSTTVVAQETNGCVDIGQNHGSSLIDLPFVPTGTPLLSRFGFAFDPGIDHHITQILIFPGLPTGMIRLDFSDVGDNNYCYNITHFDIFDPRISPVTREDICSDPGGCTVQLDKPAGDFVFVLIGLQLSFRAPYDHHLKDVAILENDGLLTVAYNDKHFDPPEDTFIWSVQYVYVPRDQFTDVGELSGTGANDRVIATMPPGKAVLRGFKFSFTGDDHHIQQISVRPNTSGTAFISYRDVNGDDKFDWDYRWAILRTLSLTPVLQVLFP
jgi:hypothetical protein